MKECNLYKPYKNIVMCTACPNNCIISDGKTGLCGVRKNINGKLFLLVNEFPVAMHVDPIEKKPLYKFMPNTKTFSFGTIGCNLRCAFCQNYDISQERSILGQKYTAEKIVGLALQNGCKSISYTYNEPTIFIEFVKEVATLAKKAGLKNIMVTNGYFTKEALNFIAPDIDAMNIDLKSFSDDFYVKQSGAKLKHVLDSIKRVHKKKIHIEITTLIIPRENDSKEELESIAKFIASVDKNIPWHISRFYPMYKMKDRKHTDIKSLEKAYNIGKKYLEHVYLGNI